MYYFDKVTVWYRRGVKTGYLKYIDNEWQDSGEDLGCSLFFKCEQLYMFWTCWMFPICTWRSGVYRYRSLCLYPYLAYCSTPGLEGAFCIIQCLGFRLCQRDLLFHLDITDNHYARVASSPATAQNDMDILVIIKYVYISMKDL